MTVTRYRPIIMNHTGTGECTECGGHAPKLHPIVVGDVEHLLCADCREEMGL